MREADCGPYAFLFDFKEDSAVVPFALVLNKVKVVVQNVPDNFFVRHLFTDLDRAAVDILEMIVVHSAELVRLAIDLLRPPRACILDGSEDFRRGLVHGKTRHVILFVHDFLLV